MNTKMCKQYQKLPTEEDSWLPAYPKEPKKQSKWKKVKKAVGVVCDFLFGDFKQLSDAERTRFDQQLMYSTNLYAVGYIGYW